MRLEMEDVCTQAVVNKTPWSPLGWDQFELDTLGLKRILVKRVLRTSMLNLKVSL